MIHTSQDINEIAKAIATAQGELENVEKAGLNPVFHAKYAKLGAVLDEVRGKFAKQGIAILQFPVNGEGNSVGVVTRLAHSSGQWIESAFYVLPTKPDAQGAGSALTYARKYSLMAVTGVAPDDDDGNAASVGTPAREAPRAGMVRAADVPPQKAADQRASDIAQANQPNGAGGEKLTIEQRAAIFRGEMMGWFAKCKLPADVGTIIKNNSKALDGLKKMAPDVYDEIMAESNRITNEMYASA